MGERFNNWYAQIEDRQGIDIQVLMDAFNHGVTPEEFNDARKEGR